MTESTDDNPLGGDEALGAENIEPASFLVFEKDEAEDFRPEESEVKKPDGLDMDFLVLPDEWEKGFRPALNGKVTWMPDETLRRARDTLKEEPELEAEEEMLENPLPEFPVPPVIPRDEAPDSDWAQYLRNAEAAEEDEEDRLLRLDDDEEFLVSVPEKPASKLAEDLPGAGTGEDEDLVEEALRLMEEDYGGVKEVPVAPVIPPVPATHRAVRGDTPLLKITLPEKQDSLDAANPFNKNASVPPVFRSLPKEPVAPPEWKPDFLTPSESYEEAEMEAPPLPEPEPQLKPVPTVELEREPVKQGSWKPALVVSALLLALAGTLFYLDWRKNHPVEKPRIIVPPVPNKAEPKAVEKKPEPEAPKVKPKPPPPKPANVPASQKPIELKPPPAAKKPLEVRRAEPITEAALIPVESLSKPEDKSLAGMTSGPDTVPAIPPEKMGQLRETPAALARAFTDASTAEERRLFLTAEERDAATLPDGALQIDRELSSNDAGRSHVLYRVTNPKTNEAFPLVLSRTDGLYSVDAEATLPFLNGELKSFVDGSSTEGLCETCLLISKKGEDFLISQPPASVKPLKLAIDSRQTAAAEKLSGLLKSENPLPVRLEIARDGDEGVKLVRLIGVGWYGREQPSAAQVKELWK